MQQRGRETCLSSVRYTLSKTGSLYVYNETNSWKIITLSQQHSSETTAVDQTQIKRWTMWVRKETTQRRDTESERDGREGWKCVMWFDNLGSRWVFSSIFYNLATLKTRQTKTPVVAGSTHSLSESFWQQERERNRQEAHSGQLPFPSDWFDRRSSVNFPLPPLLSSSPSFQTQRPPKQSLFIRPLIPLIHPLPLSLIFLFLSSFTQSARSVFSLQLLFRPRISWNQIYSDCGYGPAEADT